jgi:hypothetical protein
MPFGLCGLGALGQGGSQPAIALVVRPPLSLPARRRLPGQSPTQELRCAADGNMLMSAPRMVKILEAFENPIGYTNGGWMSIHICALGGLEGFANGLFCSGMDIFAIRRTTRRDHSFHCSSGIPNEALDVGLLLSPSSFPLGSASLIPPTPNRAGSRVWACRHSVASHSAALQGARFVVDWHRTIGEFSECS